MALQHGLFTLALSALLFTPVAATAADNTRHAASPVASNWAPGRESHRAPPPPPSHSRGRDGRYELQTVRTEVPGHYERVWIEEQCVRTRRYVRACEPGHYEQRWVPGYTQTSQQWVWVPRSRGPYGRG
ncbi:hypothetical protein F0U62_47590 [Cystobacter fuscus]|uniref:hypothetical protein n=1 Tax=Cystobacter fuscus TaxID=43 RepID=UPI002B2F3F14|nr:hypothetical protein F0U62_47590 [Cystobacter fuscus]